MSTKLRFRLYDWQKEVYYSRARFKLVIVGRRAGKTAFIAVDAITDAVRGKRIWIIAPIYKIARESWLYLQRFLKGTRAKFNKAEMSIAFPAYAGRVGMIELRTAVNARNLRGAGLDKVILDEGAHIPNGKSLWETVLLPTLLDRDGEGMITTTPLGMNWVYDLYQDAARLDDWARWQLPSTVSDHITPEKLERLRRNMSDRAFRQEFLAEFLPDGGVVFPYVHDAIDLSIDISSSRRLLNHYYVLGVDWGQMEDETAIIAMDMETKQVVDIVTTQEDYDQQIGLLKKLYLKWRPEIIIAETNGMGQPQIDRLRAEGMPVEGFKTTFSSKRLIIDELALAFRTREVKIPAHKKLIDQLNAFTSVRLPSGRERFTAPRGMHDDLVMALAFAYHGALEGDAAGVLFTA